MKLAPDDTDNEDGDIDTDDDEEDTDDDTEDDTEDEDAEDDADVDEFLLALWKCLTPNNVFFDRVALQSAALKVLLLVCYDKQVLKQAIDLGMAPAISTLHLLDSLIPELLPYDANRSLKLLLDLMLPYYDDPYFLGLSDNSEIRSFGLETALDNHLAQYPPPTYMSIREIGYAQRHLWRPTNDFLDRNFASPLASFYEEVLQFLQSLCIYPTAFRPLLLASLNFSLFRQEKGEEKSITLSFLRQSIWRDSSLPEAHHYPEEITCAHVFFILTKIGAQAPLAIDWSRVGPLYFDTDEMPMEFAELLQKAIDQASIALLPHENADTSLVLPTLNQMLKKHLDPLLQSSWLEPLLAERELWSASGRSVNIGLTCLPL